MPRNKEVNLVALTNDSSTGSKASMAALGYFEDDVIRKLVPKVERRSPLINRGYFIRVWAVDRLVKRFINLHRKEHIQIVSCGAGFDSLFLRLQNDICLDSCTFVETDLPSVVTRKRELVLRWKELTNVDNDHELFKNYFLIPCDLRNTNDFFNALVSKCGFDENKPTLFLAECVFNYLNSSETNNIIETAWKNYSLSSIIVYEQILPFDAFGRFMLDHFSHIGSPLSSIFQYSTVCDQQNRFLNLGWKNVFCFDMLHVYRNVLSIEERRRIDSIEPFDEYEMWHLKCSHYVLSVASLDDEFAKIVFDDFNIKSMKIFEPTDDGTSNGGFSHQVIDVSFSKTEIKRFGHRCALILNDDYVVICGGLGQDKNGRHRRLHSLIAINLTTYHTKNLLENSIFERSYHSFISVNSNKAFLFGGRKSPKEPLKDGYLLHFNKDPDTGVVVSYQKAELDGLTARWRHASCCVYDSSVFICGGLTWPYNILNDCWIVNFGSDGFDCSRVSDMPFSLHSHFCCSKGDEIYVFGGLTNVDDGFSRCLLLLDLKTNVWTNRYENCFPQGIYGHSGHLLDDGIVVIVGGVWENGQENHGVVVVDTLQKVVDPLKVCHLSSNDQDLIMMTNHCSAWLKNKRQLIVTGGGGNCFSFGTLLNSGLEVFNLSYF